MWSFVKSLFWVNCNVPQGKERSRVLFQLWKYVLCVVHTPLSVYAQPHQLGTVTKNILQGGESAGSKIPQAMWRVQTRLRTSLCPLLCEWLSAASQSPPLNLQLATGILSVTYFNPTGMHCKCFLNISFPGTEAKYYSVCINGFNKCCTADALGRPKCGSWH